MRQLKMIMPMVVMSLLVAGQALACDQVTASGVMAITPVDEAEVAMAADKEQGVGPCCKVGNLVPADNLMPDFISGAEKYAYMWLVEPVCECNTGFYLDTVQMIVQFGPEDVPVTIQVNASFEETQWDATGGHLIPGPPICTSPTYTGTVTEAGSFRISVPLMNANCLCAEFGYHYAVSMNIVTSLDNKLDLVLADDPVGGVSFIDQGNGWYNLDSYGIRGDVKMESKLECCSNPVKDEQPSWGHLKALFR